MDLAVIGLGKLGAPLAAVLASKGHDVVGVDLNQQFVDKVNAGLPPVQEPGLADLIAANKARLRATTDTAEAVAASSLAFVIVPTPSAADGLFTNKFVIEAVERIGAALRGTDRYYVVNITSTVVPGSCDSVIRAALERTSGRKVGENLGLCYNPEFIALGSVIRDMLYPDMLLLGQSDDRAGELLASVYQSVCERNPPMQRMSLINAEITKISVNTYVTMKISFANMLSEIAENLPGADVDVVTAAIGLDSRIGGKYLRGALGYAGPCFPRDNVAFAAVASKAGVEASLALATERVNQRQIARLNAKVDRHLPASGIVGILGMSYKPDTEVIEQSQGVALAARLAEKGYKVVFHDPAANANAKAVLGEKAEAQDAIDDVVRQADLLIVATPWPQFKSIAPAAFVRASNRRIPVIDCWRILDQRIYGEVASLVYLGRAPSMADDAIPQRKLRKA